MLLLNRPSTKTREDSTHHPYKALNWRHYLLVAVFLNAAVLFIDSPTLFFKPIFAQQHSESISSSSSSTRRKAVIEESLNSLTWRGLYACTHTNRGASARAPSNPEEISQVSDCADVSTQDFLNTVDTFRATSPECRDGAVAAQTLITFPLTLQEECLEVGVRHIIQLQMNNNSGNRRCSGGSFIEMRLQGENVIARPRVVDWGNGNMTVEIWFPNDKILVGESVTLSGSLLYTSLAGMCFGEEWIYNRPDQKIEGLLKKFTLVKKGVKCKAGVMIDVGSLNSAGGEIALPSCRATDFMSSPFWEGHWLKIRTIEAARTVTECPFNVCTGDVWNALHDPWIYRLPGCVFHFFHPLEARACLEGAHIFGSGDSQWMDTQRNFLLHTLALNISGWLRKNDFTLNSKSVDISGFRDLPRSNEPIESLPPSLQHWPSDMVTSSQEIVDIDGKTVNRIGPLRELETGDKPKKMGSTRFRLSGIFNAAPSDTEKYYGLSVVYLNAWKQRHEAAWNIYKAEKWLPDAFFMNSGMHDGKRFNGPYSLLDYTSTLEVASQYWEFLFNESTTRDGECRPRRIWRQNVVPAGDAKMMQSNPMRMEVYDRLVTAQLLSGEKKHLSSSPSTKKCQSSLSSSSSSATNRQWEWIDYYDMTWAWHFDSKCRTDGGHYGRWNCAQSKVNERSDYVDNMMLQVLLNGLCPTTTI